jgi:hypothetical protein
MNQCDGSFLLQLVDQANLLICFTGFLAAIIFKDKRWALYSGITVLFYLALVYFHCEIKAFDTEYLYRYLIWASSDLVWICLLYFLWDRGYIYDNQYFVSLVVILAVEALQGFRFIDRHFFDLQYSTQAYKSIMPTINAMIALCCCSPLINNLRIKLRKWNI